MSEEEAVAKDWKKIHANDSEKAVLHPMVENVMDELAENLKRNYGIESPLVRIGIAKVATYAAQVARAQALGFDPELLRLSPEESNAALLRRARAAVAAGVPTLKVDDDGITRLD